MKLAAEFSVFLSKSMIDLIMMETLLVQEPFVYIPEETTREALKVILGACIYRLLIRFDA
jgi:hypothetical protein